MYVVLAEEPPALTLNVVELVVPALIKWMKVIPSYEVLLPEATKPPAARAFAVES